MANIIGSVDITPNKVRPGTSVRIEVFDKDGKSFVDGLTQVSINGALGAVQFLQFPTAGQRRLIIRARAANGDTDQQVKNLDVAGKSLEFPTYHNQSDIAMLGVTQSSTQRYTAILTVGSLIDMRSLRAPKPGPSAPLQPNQVLDQTSLAALLGTRGVLGSAIATNPQTLMRSETRRLANTRVRGTTKPADGARRAAKAAKWLVVGSVYDLTNVDLDKILANATIKAPPEFEWDFGDGSTATTKTPVVHHDYFAAIDHSKGLGQFVVTCHIKHAGVTVKRSLTIHSAYAICKRMGTVAPHVTADLFAFKHYFMLEGTFTVHNVEEDPIVLDRMSVTPAAEGSDHAAMAQPFVNLENPITIAPRSASMVNVSIPFVTGTPTTGQLRFDAKGFSVLLAGAVGALPVRCSAVFDVPVAEWGIKPKPFPQPQVPAEMGMVWPWEEVETALTTVAAKLGINRGQAALDKKTGILAVSLGPLQPGHPKALTRDAALRLLSTTHAPIAAMKGKQRTLPASGRHSRDVSEPELLRDNIDLPDVSQPPASGDASHPVGLPLPGLVAAGQICDPSNLSEGDRALAEVGQLVCQLTDEVEDRLMPARWMNARKGDIILSPGGDGIIGGLLVNLSPSQLYSHSGIMTRNYDEVTHSTGSEARLYDHRIGFTKKGSDGIEPSVLKYTWPGAVTQTVQNAIEGEDFPDPEYPKSYSISSFGPHAIGITHNDQFIMISPLVVKPDPLQETPAIRSALHAIATDARGNAGRPGVKPKYHYRWYCYTDPTIGLGAPEGPDAGWAAGTRPSVCSSYIWMHAKARNAQLETDQALVLPGDLEPGDVAQGAAVQPTTPDGLYAYSAQERLYAAEWLFNYIHNLAFQKAGWLGEALTDAADDTANQILNAFANDDDDGKDSEAWKDVRDADAVSPDNILWWDGPAQGGLYGFAEPLIYREPRVESYTVSRWKQVLGRGTIRGKVYGPDGPVADSAVEVYDGKTTLSTADGGFVLENVPLGRYSLKGSKVIDGVLYSAQSNVNLDVADLAADLHLQPPADRYRIAQAFIDFWGRDEENFGYDDIENPGPEYFELELGPDKLINSAQRTYAWGGEMRVEY